MSPPLRLLLSVARVAVVTVMFLSGCLSILFSQVVYRLMLQLQPLVLHTALERTKNDFIVVCVAVFLWCVPTELLVTTDALMPAKSIVGHRLALAPNLVVIANHQIYTDWIFLWFLNYLAGMGGNIYIILKKLLRSIPGLGWGMDQYGFIFMLRKWEDDKVNMTNHLLEIDANARGFGPAQGVSQVDLSTAEGVVRWPAGVRESTSPDTAPVPYLLILFPEGTNMSPNTRPRLEAYAAKVGAAPLKHVLLPRLRGLFHSLRLLRRSVLVVYDITIGYSGTTADVYAELVYTLAEVFFRGHSPRQVAVHIRQFDLGTLPLGPDRELSDLEMEEHMPEFERWLFGVWHEKDAMMDRYYQTGRLVEKLAEQQRHVMPLGLQRWTQYPAVYVVPLSIALLARLGFLLGQYLRG